MLPSKLLDTYAHDLKTIELNRSIEEEKEISLGGLCGNLKVILPVAISYNNTYNNCFICANKKEAMLYYSNLSNFLGLDNFEIESDTALMAKALHNNTDDILETMKLSSHAKRLSGYDNKVDIEFCSMVNTQPIVPILNGNQIVLS